MEEAKNYTPAEEFANAFTHAIGAMFAIYAIVMLAVNSKTPLQKAAAAIYGVTMFILFQSSTFYHAIRHEKAKRVFRKIDHSAIYILIAGTYSPALLLTLNFPLSIFLLVIIWILAIIGIVFCCTTPKTKYLSTALYLIMGWISVFFVYNVWTTSPLTVWLLLAGGIFYSVGCAFYLIKTIPYTHFIWHLFVMAGVVMHYFAIIELLKAIN